LLLDKLNLEGMEEAFTNGVVVATASRAHARGSMP